MKNDYDKPVRPLFKKVLFGIRDYNITLVIYTFAVGLLSLATPITVQSVVNTFSLSTDIQPLINLSFMLFVLLIVYGILRGFQYITVELMQQRMVAQLSAAVAKRVILGPRHSFQTHNVREKVNRFFEIISIQKTVALLVTDGLSIGAQTFIGLILLSLYHPFFIPFNIALAAIVIVIVRYYNSEAKITAIQESGAKFAFAGYLQDIAMTESRIQSETLSLKFINHADGLIHNYINFRKKHFRILFSETIIFLTLYALVNAVLLGLGGYLIIVGQLSVGQLVAAEIIINGISIQFAYSMKHLQLYYDLYASCDKLSWLLDLDEVPVKGSGKCEELIQDGKPVSFEFRNIVLGFEEKAELNLKIEPGSYYKFLYNDSRVKEQFISYLLKNEDVLSGDIRVQDISYKDLLSLEVRNLVHTIDEPIIFDGTIRHNLFDFEKTAKQSELYEALKFFGLDEIVLALPNKLEEHIHGASNLLSYAQKYKLNLVRIYLRKPKLLIIQAGKDLFSDKALLNYLDAFQDIGCTVLFNVHDETLKQVFKITKF